MDEVRRFVLPKTRLTSKWVKTTDELRAGMKQRRTELAETIRAAQSEMDELDGALTFLANILPPRTTPNGTSEEPAAPRPIRRAPGQWSAVSETCIDCETAERPHAAHGRCDRCDRLWRKSAS